MNRPTRQDAGLVHALLYRRVSGAEHQKVGLSMGAQESATRRYVAGKDGWLIAGEFSDVMSGRKPGRPGYQAMLEVARQLHREHKRVAIVVIRLDRFGRNKVEYFRATEELAAQGAEVHSISNGGVLDETHASILAVFAAKEAADIGARVAETRAHIVSNGFHYGRCPFGYRLREATPAERSAGSVRSVIEPDPVTRGIVLEAYQRFAGGESGASVASWLAGLPADLRGGRDWPANCVTGPRGLLRSPTYVSRPPEGAEDVLERPRCSWEALVPDDVWQAVQDRLDASGGTFQRAPARTYLLSGFARCEVCGLRLVGMSMARTDQLDASGQPKRRFQYRCSGWARGAWAPVRQCRKSVPMAHADTAVIDAVASVLDTLADPDHWPEFEARWQALNKPADTDTARIADLEREVGKLNKTLASAAALLADGTLDAMGYNALRDDYTAKIKAAQGELARLASVRVPTRRVESAQSVYEMAGGWSNEWRSTRDISARRGVLDVLVESVSVRATGYRQYEASIVWTERGQRLVDAIA